MNQPVNADSVINGLAQRIANLIVDNAVKDAHIAALTVELAAAKGEPSDRAVADDS